MEDSIIDNADVSQQALLDEIAQLRQQLATEKNKTRAWQEQIQAISDSLRLGFWEWDEVENQVSYYSQGMAAIYGITLEQLYKDYRTDSDFHCLIEPSDLNHYIEHTSGIKGELNYCNNVHLFDYRIVLPDGEIRYVREIEFGVFDNNKKLIRSYGLVQDVSDYQQTSIQLRESEKRIGSLFDQLPVGVQEENYSSIKRVVDKLLYIGIDDISGYLQNNPKVLREMVGGTFITAANQALIDLHEAPSKAALLAEKSDIESWWDAERIEFYANEIHALAKGERFYEAERVESKLDGSCFETRSITTIVKGHEDDWKRVITIHEDITNRKKNEQDLVEAKTLAEKASRAKSEFLSSMSHELRTPLNAILGFSQLFEYDENLNEHQRTNATEINQAGKHLLVLIDEILDLSRIEAGEIEVSNEPVKLLEIIRESHTWVVKLAESRNVEININSELLEAVVVKADATRLKQVFLNLFTNAIKYNIRGGNVSLKLNTSVEGSVRIGVCDTGNGIGQDKLDDLFQPFNRLGAEFSDTEGTGIGLVITKQLIELMGGKLQVESESGVGSIFWIELHLAEPTEMDFIQEVTESRQIMEMMPALKLNNPYILVAEDNMINQELVAAQMDLLGYDVDYAKNGADALEKWRQGKYYVLLTDIRMPVMNGYDLIREIRAIDITGTHSVSIIAITANAMESDKVKCLEVGADDVISKPVELEELRNALEKWVPREVAKLAEDNSTEQVETAVCPIMDLKVLRQSVGYKPETHRKLLHSFTGSLPEAISDIEDAFAWRNHEKLADAAHKLKSSAKSMGALELGKICQLLEQSSRKKNWTQLESAMAQLKIQDDLVRRSVQSLIKSKKSDSLRIQAPQPLEDATVPEIDLTVLLIDDDFIMHRVTTTALNDLGIKNVLNALSGSKALEIIAGHTDDIELIICDLNMPGMDGVEFIRYLAEQHFNHSLVLTSGEDIRILRTVEKLAIERDLHVLGVIEKPVTRVKLNEMLEIFDRIKSKGAMIMTDSFTLKKLIAALDNDELDLCFQPKVDLKTRQAFGVEALVRWNHPMKGLIRPDSFISIAEENNLINRITQVVCEKAINYAKRLQREGISINIAINISIDALNDLTWPDVIADLIDDAGLEHSSITFEITESRLMEHISVALDILSRLSLKRFNLSIDDFGTGYSSMEQLQRIPFSELKIDRAFVNGAAEETSARAIIESSVLLAKKLNMKVVAEGVENKEDWDLLESLKVDQVQGHFICRPLQFDNLVDRLKDWQKLS